MQLPKKKTYPLVVINLDTGQGIELVFPSEIELEARANWKPQDVTHGTKPLLYGNTEPQKLTLPNVWLDTVGTDESISRKLIDLLDLMKKQPAAGSPPPLLVSYGDVEFHGVLESVSVKQKYFDGEGRPKRAELALVFAELQEEGAPTAPTPARVNENSSFTF